MKKHGVDVLITKIELKIVDAFIIIEEFSKRQYEKHSSVLWLAINKVSCNLGYNLIKRVYTRTSNRIYYLLNHSQNEKGAS